MAIPPRTRKRVHAIRRAPDGSAFEKCDRCGVTVAIALADMHQCRTDNKNVKRFKGISQGQDQNVTKRIYPDQPRSAFRFFMESFEGRKKGNLIYIDRKGFETWKKMSKEERRPYITQAEKVNSAYLKGLNEELIYYPQVDDDGADSAMVGKFDKLYYHGGCEESEDYDSWACDHSFETYKTETSNTDHWEMLPPPKFGVSSSS
ncbi:hypothetical protein SLE2022_065590 [Rubroshorea leprosula]